MAVRIDSAARTAGGKFIVFCVGHEGEEDFWRVCQVREGFMNGREWWGVQQNYRQGLGVGDRVVKEGRIEW